MKLLKPQNLLLGLFYFLLFVTPLYFRFITTELFEFNKMILVYATTASIAGVWIARMIIEKKIILQRTFLDTPLVLFVIIQLLASLLSMHPRTSFLGYYSRFHGGFLSTFSYFVLYYAFVSNITKKQILPLFGALFTSLSLVSLWGIFEHFGHSFSCSILTGQFDVTCWVQDVQNRVYASFGQPNWMAAFIVLVLPLVLLQSFSIKKVLLEKSFYWLTLGLALAALLFTKSRSGFIAFAIELVVMYGYSLLQIIRTTTSQTSTKKITSLFSRLKPFGITTFLIASILLIVGTPYSPPLGQVLKAETPTLPVETSPVPVDRLDVGGTDSGEIRKIVWQGAIGVWKRYPVLGSGVETFAYSYYQDRPAAHNTVSEWDFLYNKAHNEFLNFLATSGLAGLMSYLFLLGALFFKIFHTLFLSKSKDISEQEKRLLFALGTGIGALSISNFFGFSTVAVTTTMYLFFGAVALLHIPLTSSNQKTPQQSLSGGQYSLLTIMILVLLVLLARIYAYWSADVHYSSAKTLLNSGEYQRGIAQMEQAISLSPKEALFYDTFSAELAQLSVALAQQGDATTAAQVAQTAISMSDTALTLNSAHLNFYKTRTRMFITLSQLEPNLLLQAKETLLAGIQRAPNDPKLFYNLAIVESTLGNEEEGLALLEKTIDLKPDYLAARLQLGKAYARAEKTTAAQSQFAFILENIDPQNQSALDELQLLEANN